ncbi:MAG: flagellar basal-body rod protein FlgF [Deltaproteobacteria bacterium]|nr:flagellar basal-body rod protein FlgF [Deltaproteobacteria bacterium]
MGSPNGLWTAVSGGMAQSQNLDIIANNLANTNTAGFKKDSPTFKEFLTAVERPPSPDIDIPRTAFKDSDFYHFDGREHAMVNLDKITTDHTQGSFKNTNAPFDMAIDGAGFFAVQTPNGLMYTRSGDFKVNGEGQLVNQEGYPVLALSGDAAEAASPANQQPPQQPAAPEAARNPASLNPFTAPYPAPDGGKALLKPISLKDAIQTGHKIHVSPEGEIYADDEQIAKLAVAEFADPRLLKKENTTLYSNPDAANVPRIDGGSRVRQGFLEQSNVNPVSELVNLLKANRLFESNMRAIKAYNDMAGKEANEVGKL